MRSLLASHRLGAAACAVLLITGASAPTVRADEADLRQQVQELRQRIEAQEAELEDQRRTIERLRGDHERSWLDARRSEQVRALVAEVLADAEQREAHFTSGWERGFVLQSADGNYQMNIGGWIQPRYQFTSRPDGEDTSSFLMRRVRLDVRGHVFSPELTFRVMPELSRTANLRDAWINYAFAPALQVRGGQFTIPLQWHRFVGPRRQHFAERGAPSETFGFPTGRDIGVMAHGRALDERVAYGVGFFDGAGRNVATSNSDGHMASARLTWAVLGDLPREESDLAWSEQPHLSVGGGAQGAWRNEARDWALGRSPVGNDRADWATATADARFAWRGFSLAAEGYLRYVDPQDPAVGSYDGWAYLVTAGHFLVPEKYELVGRWSQLQLDRDDGETRLDEWGVGLNIYHRGHDWKTRVNYLHERDKALGRTPTFLIEHHLQF